MSPQPNLFLSIAEMQKALDALSPGPWHHHLSGCGVHAYHDLNTLIATEEWAAPGAGLTLSPTGILPPMRTIVPDVLGAVIGLGRMRIHPKGHGWRAQRARIVALALHPRYEKSRDRARGLRILAKHYGVPAVASSQLEERAREFGEPRVPDAPAESGYPGTSSAATGYLRAATVSLRLSGLYVPPGVECFAAFEQALHPRLRADASLDVEFDYTRGTRMVARCRFGVGTYELTVEAVGDFVGVARWMAERCNESNGPRSARAPFPLASGIVEYSEDFNMPYHPGMSVKP